MGRNGVFLAEVGRSAGPVEEVPGSSGINWPNSITVLPSEVFGFRALALGDGFLVPSHTTGGVWIMEAKARPKRLKRPVARREEWVDIGYYIGIFTPLFCFRERKDRRRTHNRKVVDMFV